MRPDLHDAAEVAGRDDVGLGALQVRGLARPEPRRDRRLEHVVGSGGAAAQMPLGRRPDVEPRFRQQAPRRLGELLSVAQGAGVVIGDDRRSRRPRLQVQAREQLGHVDGARGHGRRRLAEFRPVAEQVGVVLDRGAAPGGVGDDGVEAAALDLAPPRPHAPLRRAQRRPFVAEMKVERAAAAGALGDDHLASVPPQDAHRRLVDLRPRHRLDAARQQRRPHDPLAFRGVAAGGGGRRRAAGDAGRQPRQRRQARRQQRRKPARQGARRHGDAERRRPDQHPAQDAPQPAVRPRAAERRFDADARLVDEAPVVDPRRARRLARQAGEAAVDVLDGLRRRGAAGLQHFLHEVDAPARRVELVPEQDVGRAGRQAEPAVDALPQHAVRVRDQGIGELLLGETGLHGADAP